MPREKEHDLVRGLQRRIRRAVDDGDSSWVLDPEAVHDAERLLKRASAHGASGLEVVRTVAWLYWCRYLALPPGEDREDFMRAMTLFARVYHERPDLQRP